MRVVQKPREDWNLITKKRSNHRFFSLAENARSFGGSKVVTVYVDNLPEDMDAEWLGQIFSKYGRVLDAFIPKKRSKYFQSKFGFIRFNVLREAEEAIADLNGIIIRDKKMLVKLASFTVEKDQGGPFHNHSIISNKNIVNKVGKEYMVNKQNGANLGKVIGKSYADAVVVNRKFEPKRIFVNAIGNEWLTRSVVARLKSLSSMDSIRDLLHCKGIPQIEVKDMGGLWVVLTFPSIELMQSVFDGDLNWLMNCFAEVKKWSPDIEDVRRRNVWISCYGVPLHGWSAVTFRKIAQLWGEVITMDESTIKGLSFAAGKIMIATDKWERINESIEIEVKGKSFEVRVVEEQVVIHGHCSICSFSPSESNKVDSSNSEEESVDELRSVHEVVHDGWTNKKLATLDNSIGVSCVKDSILEASEKELAAEKSTGIKDVGIPTLVYSSKTESNEGVNEAVGNGIINGVGDIGVDGPFQECIEEGEIKEIESQMPIYEEPRNITKELGPVANSELSNYFEEEDTVLSASNKDEKVVNFDQGFWNLSEVGFFNEKDVEGIQLVVDLNPAIAVEDIRKGKLDQKKIEKRLGFPKTK